MDELKPCPFCGGEAEVNRVNHVSEWAFEVRCPGCGCGTDYAYSAEEAISFWNARPDPESKPLTWIPISERMPVGNEYREETTGELIPLLVCVEGTEYPFRAMYDGKSWGDGIGKLNVAYWMPLPEPPDARKPEQEGQT